MRCSLRRRATTRRLEPAVDADGLDAGLLRPRRRGPRRRGRPSAGGDGTTAQMRVPALRPRGYLHGARRILLRCTEARPEHRLRSSALCTAPRCAPSTRTPSYGVRQLVDIAIRALSQAINDPTTAVRPSTGSTGSCAPSSDRPDPSGVSLDSPVRPAWWSRCSDWTRVFDLAFTEVALYGAGESPDLAQADGDLRRPVLARDAGPPGAPSTRVACWLRNEVAGRHSLEVDQLLTADPLGLG